MAMPKWGNGPYAGRLGSTSQTVGHHGLDEAPAGSSELHHVHAYAGADGLVVQDDGRVPGG